MRMDVCDKIRWRLRMRWRGALSESGVERPTPVKDQSECRSDCCLNWQVAELGVKERVMELMSSADPAYPARRSHPLLGKEAIHHPAPVRNSSLPKEMGATEESFRW